MPVTMDDKRNIFISNEYSKKNGTSGSRGSSLGSYVEGYMCREDACEVGYGIALNNRDYLSQIDLIDDISMQASTTAEYDEAFSETFGYAGFAFDDDSINLQPEAVKRKADLMQKAFDSHRPVYKMIISFKYEFLARYELVPEMSEEERESLEKGDLYGLLDQTKLRLALQRAMHRLSLDKNNLHWIGAIQTDTKNIHCHFCMAEFQGRRKNYRAASVAKKTAKYIHDDEPMETAYITVRQGNQMRTTIVSSLEQMLCVDYMPSLSQSLSHLKDVQKKRIVINELNSIRQPVVLSKLVSRQLEAQSEQEADGAEFAYMPVHRNVIASPREAIEPEKGTSASNSAPSVSSVPSTMLNHISSYADSLLFEQRQYALYQSLLEIEREEAKREAQKLEESQQIDYINSRLSERDASLRELCAQSVVNELSRQIRRSSPAQLNISNARQKLGKILSLYGEASRRLEYHRTQAMRYNDLLARFPRNAGRGSILLKRFYESEMEYHSKCCAKYLHIVPQKFPADLVDSLEDDTAAKEIAAIEDPSSVEKHLDARFAKRREAFAAALYGYQKNRLGQWEKGFAYPLSEVKYIDAHFDVAASFGTANEQDLSSKIRTGGEAGQKAFVAFFMESQKRKNAADNARYYLEATDQRQFADLIPDAEINAMRKAAVNLRQMIFADNDSNENEAVIDQKRQERDDSHIPINLRAETSVLLEGAVNLALEKELDRYELSL